MSKLSTRPRARSSPGEARPCAGVRKGSLHAAGVAIGAHELVACVPDGEDQQLVRTFGPYTTDLQTLADWCVDRGSETIARASTGGYGIPLFEALEARGLRGCLLSAQSIYPGRLAHLTLPEGR
jgi:hypothetical protein